jgi:hypothetical protein
MGNEERLKSCELRSVLSNATNNGYEDCNDLVCLAVQLTERCVVNSAIVSKQFEPEQRFVGGLTEMCCDRCAGAQKLIADDLDLSASACEAFQHCEISESPLSLFQRFSFSAFSSQPSAPIHLGA